MDFVTAMTKLKSLGQEHLLSFWSLLNESQKKILLQQIDALDIAMFDIQRHHLYGTPKASAYDGIRPLTKYAVAGNVNDQLLGDNAIARGSLGCVVVAGGQGSRLGVEVPKGMFPVSVIENKTLFQLFAERTLAASHKAGRPLPLAIMTSPINDEMTRDYFHLQNFFGLNPNQVSFFPQGMLPFVTPEGNLLLQDRHLIALGPDGNGGALHHFHHSGIWQQWVEAGVTDICFIQIDNALADPFDAELIGYHHRLKADVTLKATLRQRPDEHVGVLVEHDGRLAVVEYTEMPPSEMTAALPDGSLKYRCANLSMFCFSMDFIARIASINLDDFPVHFAYKTVRVIKDDQLVDVKAWKCERFIFDTLFFATSTEVLVYPRETCYSPLKNASGPDSLPIVKQALQNLDRKTFEAITGVPLTTQRAFELSQQFYYPTPELLQRWKNHSLPSTDYIQP